MAREYAQIKLAIWQDDDWRDLSFPARYLYFTLLTSPSLSHAGVADWRPKRISALNGMSVEEIEAAGTELVDRLYLVIDESTDEALIRSFIRNDGLMKQPKMAVAMATAHSAAASKGIRGVIVHELQRLQEDFPDLHGWSTEKAKEVLALRSIDPSTYPCGKGSGKGNSTPIKKGSPTPAPTPAPTTNNQQPSRSRPAKRLPDSWEPTAEHRQRCSSEGIDIDSQVQRFKAHAEANDRKQANWNAAFTQWLLNVKSYEKGRARPAGATPFPENGTREEQDAWVRAQPRSIEHVMFSGEPA